MSAHTPWQLQQDAKWPWTYYINDANGGAVVDVRLNTYSTADTQAKANSRPDNAQVHANAAFIVRAANSFDDLVAALEELENQIALNVQEGSAALWSVPGTFAAVKKARAAIAKARA